MALEYTGVGMFEFKYNPQTKGWILIEINARFWGSLPLAVYAGIDFPAMYAHVLLKQYVPDKLNYNNAAFARSFTSDVYAIKNEYDTLKYKGESKLALKTLIVRLIGFARLLTGNDSIDSFRFSDQRPFWHEFYHLFSDKVHKLPIVRDHRRKSRIRKFGQTLKGKKTDVLFICYGNIMRSPFADKLFSKKIKGTALEHLTVDSYGFHQVIDRNAKPQCIDMAKSWGIDLSDHKSKWLQHKHCDNQHTLVVIMDNKNEYLLNSYYPNVDYISLADLIPKSYGFIDEIKDPYDMPADYLKECYQLIDVSLVQLIKRMAKEV